MGDPARRFTHSIVRGSLCKEAVIELSDCERSDFQAGCFRRFPTTLLDLRLAQSHVVRLGPHAYLHAVETNLLGDLERTRIVHLSDRPVARADLESALFGRGKQWRETRADSHSGCGHEPTVGASHVVTIEEMKYS